LITTLQELDNAPNEIRNGKLWDDSSRMVGSTLHQVLHASYSRRQALIHLQFDFSWIALQEIQLIF
jgi:hypothetical protein